ncbi:MAG: TetR family transcriptional regulator [Candidatus Gastranaerophilales bacterium]|nr:TetR family transcriptional regulator [Candidatus Gastranaerophilales bacterium]
MKKVTKENKRIKIIEAAVKLFAKNGFEATSTRDICKLAGANISLIAYYFGGKKELYDKIINSFAQQLDAQMRIFINPDTDLDILSVKEKIDLIKLLIDKMMDYFYNSVSSYMIDILIKEQQNPNTSISSPPYNFLRKILGSIFNQKPDSKEIVYKAVFIVSQIAFVRITPIFSLRVFGQAKFEPDDIIYIKNNLQLAIKALFNEAGVNYE